MNHLQQAKHSINRAATAQSHEHATLAVQIAIGHTLIAIAEKLDKVLDIYDYEQDHNLRK